MIEKNKTILFENFCFDSPVFIFVVYTRNKEFMEVGDRIDEWVNQCYVESFPRRIGLSYSGGWRLLLSMKNNFGNAANRNAGICCWSME